MREGSYTQIEKGMRVDGRDGRTIGGVDEVVYDEGSDIFVGLAVKPNLFTHPLLIPGDRIDRVHDGIVYADTVESELQPYQTAAEKIQESQSRPFARESEAA